MSMNGINFHASRHPEEYLFKLIGVIQFPAPETLEKRKLLLFLTATVREFSFGLEKQNKKLEQQSESLLKVLFTSASSCMNELLADTQKFTLEEFINSLNLMIPFRCFLSASSSRQSSV